MANLVPESKLVPSRMRTVGGVYGPGVSGGIPTGSGYTTVNITPSGSDIGTPLQAALNAIGNGEVANKLFVVPAGNYTMGNIQLPGGRFGSHNYIVRGSGSGQAGGSATNITITGKFAKDDYSPRYNDGDTIYTPWTDIASGLTKDSTSVTVDDATGFEVGRLALIEYPNEYSPSGDGVFVFQPNSVQQYLRNQQVMITDVSGNVVSFLPPLVDDFSDLEALTGLPARMKTDTERAPVTGFGLEGVNLIRSGSSTDPVLRLGMMYNCWLKDVKVEGQLNDGIYLVYCTNFEVRKCWIGATGDSSFHSNQGGLKPDFTTNLFIEDCILEGNFPCLEYWSSNTHSIFGYNFIPWAGYGIGYNSHNAHNSFLIAEGNVMPNFQTESYFGSQSEIVAHRNWIHGRDATSQGAPGTYDLFSGGSWGSTTDIQRFIRNTAVVGNLLRAPVGPPPDNGHWFGYPYQYWTEFGSAQPSVGDWWHDWDTVNNRPKQWTGTTVSHNDAAGTMVIEMTSTAIADSLEASLVAASGNGGSRERWFSFFPLNGNFGTRVGNQYTITCNPGQTFPSDGSAITIWPGVWGFREHDLDVAATMTLRANHNYYDNAIPSGEAIGADTLQDSVYHSAKPSWFGSLVWPPIDPTDAPASFDETTISNLLPAAYRYYNGTDDYLNIVAAPSFSPEAGTFGSAQNVTITSSTPGATIRYTTDGSAPTSAIGTIYAGPVSVASTTTIKAIAYDGIMDDSDVTTGIFFIGSTVSTPSFTPSAGSFAGTQIVAISCATSGATIRYTTDGSTPSEANGTIYSTPIGVPITTTIKAFATKAGLVDSEVATGVFTITPAGGGGSASAGAITASVFNLAG